MNADRAIHGRSPDESMPSDVDTLLADLDAEQRIAVITEAEPLCILAGAGAGKTRVLTRRIAYRNAVGNLDPRHTLALTFTNRAAHELRGRLDAFGWRDMPTTGTFHAIAYAQLRSWWATQHAAEPALLDRKTRLISRLLPARFPLRPATVAAEIEWAQARGISPEGFAEEAHRTGRRCAVDPERIAKIYQDYRQEKLHRRVVDFDDLLATCTRALHDDPAFARSQQWRFRHIFVDEYQDVNQLQHDLLRAWLGQRIDLCVVGDANQSIYRWNGADAGYLTGFIAEYPSAQVVTLGTNHRSSPAIVRVGDAILATPPDVDPRATNHRVTTRKSDHDDGAPPTITQCADDEREALTIARAIRAARRPGERWARQAVLVRTNAQATVIADLFTRAGIPSRVKASRPFADNPTVRDALRSASRSRSPLQTWLADLDEATKSAGELASERVSDIDPDLSDRITAMNALITYGRQLLTEQPTVDAAAFPTWLTVTVRSDEQASARSDAVDVVSFHAAKGLEWPIVHLAGFEEGYVPSSMARDSAALEEEQRLLYVAITRAEEQLHVTWARRRTFGVKTVQRQPSRWLPAMAVAIGTRASHPKNSDASTDREHFDSARTTLVRAKSIPAAEHERKEISRALDTWRKHVARSANIPSSVVLPDLVLARLTSIGPRTPAELATVDGLGTLKAARYGTDILAVIESARNPVSTPRPAP